MYYNLHSGAQGKKKNNRRKVRFAFNGQLYGIGRLVLAVVRQYVADNPCIDFNGLREKFTRLVVCSKADADAVLRRTGCKRHFLDPEEIIHLDDGENVAVYSAWGMDNIDRFLILASRLGFKIEKIEECDLSSIESCK